jgi:hypothetical protein
MQGQGPGSYQGNAVGAKRLFAVHHSYASQVVGGRYIFGKKCRRRSFFRPALLRALPSHLPFCFPAVPPTPPADPTRIRLSSSLEVNYWCQTLNCTETRLRNAVLAVGPLSADVRAYLAR